MSKRQTSPTPAVDERADVEPTRCILDIDLDGTVSVTLLDECSPTDAHYAAGVVAGTDPELTPLAVRHVRTCSRYHMPNPPRQNPALVNIYDARSRFSRLVSEIENTGQGVIIARNGRPLVQLLPLRESNCS